MRSCLSWVMLGALSFGAIGCVAQSEADKYRNLYRTSESQKLDLQAQLEEANARIRALQAMPKDDANLAAELDAALAERDRLQAALDEAKQQLLNMAAGPKLPEPLHNALADLAASNPSLMTYDAELGMIRLRSDLTFALGSTKVSSQATTSLGRLAGVLNSSAAQAYEVRVVGHTDNVPVKNPTNVKKYGDNWGLSAFRAIAVKNVLQKAGVSPNRMNISGYGQYRPIAPNGRKGAEANRRVEIYLVTMVQSSAASDAAPATTSDAPAMVPASESVDTPAPAQPSVYK